MTTRQLANKIPHEFRERILLEWLPAAQASAANPAFQILFDAYYIYIEPDGIPKPECHICRTNVLSNWINLKEALIAAEKDYHALNDLL